jgi:hypothetical protein
MNAEGDAMDGILDRRRGALIGLAVGDALGAAIEFQPPGYLLHTCPVIEMAAHWA